VLTDLFIVSGQTSIPIDFIGTGCLIIMSIWSSPIPIERVNELEYCTPIFRFSICIAQEVPTLLTFFDNILRTVIIGQNQSVGKRNVGVECRVATRDVGMLFSADDEKPSTRSVGVNVDTGAFMNTLNFNSEEMRSALKEMLSLHSSCQHFDSVL
jgi:hypothetical protein